MKTIANEIALNYCRLNPRCLELERALDRLPISGPCPFACDVRSKVMVRASGVRLPSGVWKLKLADPGSSVMRGTRWPVSGVDPGFGRGILLRGLGPLCALSAGKLANSEKAAEAPGSHAWMLH